MKKKSNFFIILGSLLLSSSIVLFIYIKVEQNKKFNEAFETEKEFVNQLSKNKLGSKKKKNQRDRISNNQARGVIRINKLGVLAEIYNNTESETLLKGVGVIETTDLPSSKPGTISALAGHRGGRNEKLLFFKIDKLEAGDEIQVTTKDEVLVYKVVEQEIIEANDWSKFTSEADKSKLILMACHPYPSNYQRILVKAELKD